MDTQILEQIGLSKNEIKVYFALLELDQSSATPIVKKSGVSNSKLYPTLEKLIKKGLVSYVIKSNVKYFQASDPRDLIELINAKEKQISTQKQEIKELIPKIQEKRKNSQDKQEASVYEGIKGIKSVFDLITNSLKNGEEYSVFTLGEELKEEKLITFFQNYHKKRIEKNISVKLIAPKEIKQIFEKHHKYKKMKIKYTSLKLPSGIFIFNDNVMTVIWGGQPSAFVIQSKQNARRYKEFFDELWKISPK